MTKDVVFTIIDGPSGTVFSVPGSTPIVAIVALTSIVNHLNEITVRLRAAEDELANFCGYAPKRND